MTGGEGAELVVDGRGATDLPGIFGAGDCTTVPYKQIVVALGAGSTAALSAFDHLIRTDSPSRTHSVAATKEADGPGDEIDTPDIASGAQRP